MAGAHLVVLGLNHKTAPVSVRERFAIPEAALPETAALVRAAGFDESFVLSTCNRVEIYATRAEPEGADLSLRNVLAQVGKTRRGSLGSHVYAHVGDDALLHLFRVAASLDSMVVGEPQILGQMKAAFETCRQGGLTGPQLNHAVERAFAVAKRVRTHTGIARSVVSISSVAVDLARQIFGDLGPHTAALVGAGEMGELAARHLCQAGVETLLVANRSLDKAQRVAEELGGNPRALSELPSLLLDADIVITSTGAPHYIIDKKMMRRVLKARKYRPIFLIDIAVPRNIDPGCNGLDNVYVYDVDDLHNIADENLAGRQREAAAAEEMVASEAIRFHKEQAGLAVKPTIVALRRKAMEIKRAELDRARRRLVGLDEKQLKAVDVLADGIINKLLHGIQMGLKRAAAEERPDGLVHAVHELFDLKDEDLKDEGQR